MTAISDLQAFKEAVQRRVAAYKKLPRGAHVLDLGCGTGFTATAAALAGAHSVTACDLHTPMANLTRRVMLHRLPAELNAGAESTDGSSAFASDDVLFAAVSLWSSVYQETTLLA